MCEKKAVHKFGFFSVAFCNFALMAYAIFQCLRKGLHSTPSAYEKSTFQNAGRYDFLFHLGDLLQFTRVRNWSQIVIGGISYNMQQRFYPIIALNL